MVNPTTSHPSGFPLTSTQSLYEVRGMRSPDLPVASSTSTRNCKLSRLQTAQSVPVLQHSPVDSIDFLPITEMKRDEGLNNPELIYLQTT